MKTPNLMEVAKHLTQSMNQQLDALDDPQDSLSRIQKSLLIVRNTLHELKAHVRTTAFHTVEEEIQFFKEIKPPFLALYLFYEQLTVIKAQTPPGDKSSISEFYLGRINRCQQFIRKNLEFYTYYSSGNKTFDTVYFTRHKGLPNPLQDDSFSTSHDILLARILAAEMLKDYLLQGLKKIPDAITNPLQWTAPKAALIELIYALHSSEALNQGSADLKHLATGLEALFQVNLGNYYRAFQEIRQRKINRTSFLDQMKQKFIQRMDAMDES